MLIAAALLMTAAPAPARPQPAAKPDAAEAVPTVDIGAATSAFEELCLKSRSAAEARGKIEAAGFTKGQTLPGLMGAAPLDTYGKAPLDVAIRQSRDGDFDCILIFAPNAAADNAAVAGAVTALPGLALKSSKGGARNWRATWMPLQAPKGSKIYLTIGHGIGHRSAILTFEAKAEK
jgi:hypothetical protein